MDTNKILAELRAQGGEEFGWQRRRAGGGTRLPAQGQLLHRHGAVARGGRGQCPAGREITLVGVTVAFLFAGVVRRERQLSLAGVAA